MSELLSVILGALLAGGGQLANSIIERRREREAVLTAIASEVDSICRLVRHQRYFEEAEKVAAKIQNGNWDGCGFVIDIRENYFVAYEGLVEKIGLLNPDHVAKIVNFYAYCKSVIDSTRVDGPHAQSDELESLAMNMLALHQILRAVLVLGDEIVLLPKHAGIYQQNASNRIAA